MSEQDWNSIKKESPTQVFSCDFYEFFQKAFFTENLKIEILFWNNVVSMTDKK